MHYVKVINEIFSMYYFLYGINLYINSMWNWIRAIGAMGITLTFKHGKY